MTSYEEIYNLALTLIDDVILAQLPEEDLENELFNFMTQSILKLPKLKYELSDRNDTDKVFNVDLSDVTKMSLALMMKRCWLQPQISSITLTLQRSSKRESHSQAQHLKELMALDQSIALEIKQLLRDYSYVDNEYFE